LQQPETRTSRIAARVVLVAIVSLVGLADTVARASLQAAASPMQNLKVVALVSGGKDSTMNMMRCVEQGHSIVCLGNLFPAPSEDDELDSFMYQTVGHDGIEAIAACMELPLYRRPIRPKSSINQDLEYTTTQGDEVEDLFVLLQIVKQHHPEVNAVATGAILSNYQRTRVEAVCMRLGLVSLSFLWQCDQAELLDEMIDAGASAACAKPVLDRPCCHACRRPLCYVYACCVGWCLKSRREAGRNRGISDQDCMHGSFNAKTFGQDAAASARHTASSECRVRGPHMRGGW